MRSRSFRTARLLFWLLLVQMQVVLPVQAQEGGKEGGTTLALAVRGRELIDKHETEKALEVFQRYLEVAGTPAKKALARTVIEELQAARGPLLKITSVPPGASVMLDGKSESKPGQTPLSLRVSPGVHRLSLELAGYETVSTTVNTAGRREVELPFTLLSKGCVLRVISQPAGARVSINGKPAGAAPLTQSVKDGVYTVSAQQGPTGTAVSREVTCSEKAQRNLEVMLAAPLPPRRILPEHPGRDVIKESFQDLNARLADCRDQFRHAGTYNIRMTIAENGRVTEASIQGRRKDAAGECLLRVIQQAQFPEFTGDPLDLTYPFILR